MNARHLACERRPCSNAFDVLTVALFLAVLCSFGICWLADKFDAPFVAELRLDQDRSNLEGKTYASFPELSRASVLSTDFQDGVESFIADRMPLRDDILLINASWQRLLISLSALAHGYEVYPTFFGSSYVYDSAHDALYETLVDVDTETRDRYVSAANAANSFSERHPELDTYFYRIDRLSSSSNNPTNSLQNGVINSELLSEYYFDLLQGVEIIDGRQGSQGESLDVFFRSDHHWNGDDAYDAYCAILSAMAPGAKILSGTEHVSYASPAFQGSCARAGLCPLRSPDHIEDYVFDMSAYEIEIDGEPASDQSLQHTMLYQSKEWSTDRFMNRYAEYWHSDFGLIEMRNDSAQTRETLLIVRDSFGAPVERYFADCWQTVYVIDPRYFEGTVEEFLANHEVDDVLFLWGSTNFSSDRAIEWLR